MTRQAVARWPLALMCAVALWVLTALPAYAHASLLDTDPAEGARLDVAPREVTFTFSEPVSVLPDAVTLLTHDEPARTMTATSVGAVVTVTLPDLAPDQRYSVAWRVVSADGHPVSGMLTFSVGDPPAGTPALQPEATQQPVVEVAYIGWTAVWYAVVLLTAGLLVFQLVCVRRGARQVPTQLLHAAAIVGGLAVLTLLALQAARLAGPRGTPSLTLIGWPPIAAAAATVGGLTVAWFLARRGQLRGPVVAVAVAAASPILVGHSAAVAPRWLMLTAGLVHLAVVAVWAGGVLGLVLHLRRAAAQGDTAEDSAQVVGRFSALAATTLGAAALTGAAMALLILPDTRALIGTKWGRLLLLKVAVVAVVAVIGGWNRFGLIPRVGRAGPAGWRALRRTLRGEAILLIIVALLTGVLVNLSPTPAAPAPSTPATTSTAQAVRGQTEDLIVAGMVTPQADGTMQFRFSAADAEGVTVPIIEPPAVTTRLATQNLGPTRLEAHEGPQPGTYEVDLIMPARGDWEILVGLRRSAFEQRTVRLEVTL